MEIHAAMLEVEAVPLRGQRAAGSGKRWGRGCGDGHGGRFKTGGPNLRDEPL